MIIPVEQHPPALHVYVYHFFGLGIFLSAWRACCPHAPGLWAAPSLTLTVSVPKAPPPWRIAPTRFRSGSGTLPHTPESRRGACRAPLCHAYSSVHLQRFVQPRVGDLQPISSFGMSPRAHSRTRRQQHARARFRAQMAQPYYAETGTLRHPTAAGTCASAWWQRPWRPARRIGYACAGHALSFARRNGYATVGGEARRRPARDKKRAALGPPCYRVLPRSVRVSVPGGNRT